MEDRYDVAIIGGGPGGYVAAIRAAQLGGRVALVERERVGGVCLNHGCIPTKALLASAERLHVARDAERFGILGCEGARPDWSRIQQRKAEVVDTLVSGIERLLRDHRIALFPGTARLEDPRTVHVLLRDGAGEAVLRAGRIILATGSEPASLPVPGADLPGVLDSRDLLALSQLPGSLVVIGAGVIGMEMALLFRWLGAEVAVVEMLPNILPPVEPELARRFATIARQQGIVLQTGARVTEIRQGEDGRLGVVYEGKKGVEVAWGERVLVATGRRPSDGGLDLERLGIARQGRAIAVNDRLETSVPGIWAIGDCTGGALLAHRASYHGEVAAENALGSRRAVDERAIPYAVYTWPEIAGVGWTAEQARAAGRPVAESRFPFTANGRAHTLGETGGQVRLVYDPGEGTVLGIHILGPHASELIGEAALAVQARLKVGELAQTVHAHPTLSEALMEAAKAAAHGEAIHVRRQG
ncbi:MAG: dihydrolipoyl dehydrogenase [Chloroflexia bacterium]